MVTYQALRPDPHRKRVQAAYTEQFPAPPDSDIPMYDHAGDAMGCYAGNRRLTYSHHRQ